MDAEHLMAHTLELGTHGVIDMPARRREAHERRRNIQILEATRHGVLAADGTHAKVDLRHEGTEQRRGGFAPALGDIAQGAKVLLESQIGILARKASGHELGHTLDNRKVRALELIGRR